MDLNVTFQTSMASYNNSTSEPDVVTTMHLDDCDKGGVFLLVVGVIIPSVFCILGMFGNILSLFILHQDKYPGPTFYSLRFLAGSDTCLLISAFLAQNIPMICYQTGSIGTFCYYVVAIRPYIWPVVNITQLTTIWLTLLISAERYVAICHPLKARKMCTIEKVKGATITITIVAILYNIPKWFEFRTTEWKRCGGKTLTVVDAGLRDNTVYRYFYNIVLQCIVQFAIPMFTLAFFNIRMVQVMQKARKSWELLNRKRRRELRAAVIPMVIVIIFFITSTQSLTIFILDAVFVTIKATWLQHYTGIVNLLVILNSAINFIIFYMFGSRFRLLLFRTLKGAVKRSSHKLKRKGAQVQHSGSSRKTPKAFLEVVPPTSAGNSTEYTSLNTPDTDFMKSFLSVPQTHDERRSSCQWSEYSDNSDDSTPRYAIKK